jgi:broad specificity phosphatase PhoE
MCKVFIAAAIFFLSSCKTTQYFIVRHAEKETAAAMNADVPLSEAGKQRAQALREALEKENILHIYSTNFIRTKATAQPLADAKGLPIEIYNAADSSFADRLKKENGNVLVVGHSNTVDDLLNKLLGEKLFTDLADTRYGDLFVVRRKGQRLWLEERHFGK